MLNIIYFNYTKLESFLWKAFRKSICLNSLFCTCICQLAIYITRLLGIGKVIRWFNNQLPFLFFFYLHKLLMMCLSNFSGIGSDGIQSDTMSKVGSRIDAMKKRKFSSKSHGQMVKRGLSILILFSFNLALFYNIQRFLTFIILIFLIIYQCLNLMMLLFLSATAIKLIFSKFTCYVLKIIGNLIKN